MKCTINNRCFKSFYFSSENDFSIFITNQEVERKIIFGESKGEQWYCFVCYDSLTLEKLFVIGFDSDLRQDDLVFLYWAKNDLLVFHNGYNIIIINDKIEIVAKYLITTPLIGFHITKLNYLLILEEASIKLVSSNGDILKKEQFDLLEDFYINDNQLNIKFNGIEKIIDLC